MIKTLSKVSDTKLRIIRVICVQIISLMSASIFALYLTVETYSNYLLMVLSLNFPMIFMPSLFLVYNQKKSKVYELDLVGFIAIVALSLSLNIITSHIYKTSDFYISQIYILTAYLSSEIALISRNRSNILFYSVITILLAFPPLIAAIIFAFVENTSSEQIIFVQTLINVVCVLIAIIILRRTKTIDLKYMNKPTFENLRNQKFSSGVFFSISSNLSGFFFQYILRNVFVDLSKQNDTNLYNFALSILQRIHLIYDSISEKFFHVKNESKPKFLNSFDISFLIIFVICLSFFILTKDDKLVILSLTSGTILAQALAARHHHYLLGQSKLAHVAVLYSCLAFALVIIHNVFPTNILITSISLLFIYVSMLCSLFTLVYYYEK